MAKTTEKYVIADGIYIYKADNSSNWFARFKIDTGWLTKTTKEKDLQAAMVKAIELRVEYQTKFDNNLPVFTGAKSKANSFTDIAKKAIKRMESEVANGSGKVAFKDYIYALNKYHIPYFDKTGIRDIDALALKDFDAWRIEQLTRVPAKSTICTHNAAMERVFDEAVMGGHITATELPKLENNGRADDRYAAFLPDEYKAVLAASEDWIKTARKQVTKDIRILLNYYIQFAIFTGMRPGNEIEQLTWGDVHNIKIKGKSYTAITVRKGKTTKYTGTREVICNTDVLAVLKGVKATLEKADKDDLIFSMPNGKRCTEISTSFTRLLIKIGLKKSAYGELVLYSLRHSYITWQLQNKVDMVVIAAQCGTSVKMIEEHYSHVTASMFAEELAGTGGTLNLTSLPEIDILDTALGDGGKTLVIKDGVVIQE